MLRCAQHDTKMKRLIVAILVLLIAGIGYAERVRIHDFFRKGNQLILPPAVTYEETKDVVVPPPAEEPKPQPVPELKKEEPTPTPEPKKEPGASSLPDHINLAVPFTSQAPDGDWSEPWQNACEEASLYMVHEYYAGREGGVIPVAEAKKALLSIVAFENGAFGDYLDTTAAQTALIAEQFYGVSKVELKDYPTVDYLKEQLAAGRPILVPAAGRELGNPNFVAPGPLYHMFVLRGYTKDGFITNDPGTRKGEGYIYPFKTLMAAIHDWNGGDVYSGQPTVIVVYPE